MIIRAASVIGDAHDLVAEVGPRFYLLDELPRQGARAQDQHPIGEGPMPHDGVADGPEREQECDDDQEAREERPISHPHLGEERVKAG